MSSENTDDDEITRQNFEVFFQKDQPKEMEKSLIDRISLDFLRKMRKIFDLKCDCQMCLRYIEPHDDAKV